jgi:hypothetical protein
MDESPLLLAVVGAAFSLTKDDDGGADEGVVVLVANKAAYRL